jgi:uncharacterized membrane protein
MSIVELVAGYASAAIDLAGVGIIAVGVVIGALAGVLHLFRGGTRAESFYVARHRIGSAILLGLEFLVAGDIIRTVAVDFTLEAIAGLAAIILIRTFLSFALEVEMMGRWPWQAAARSAPQTHEGAGEDSTSSSARG